MRRCRPETGSGRRSQARDDVRLRRRRRYLGESDVDRDTVVVECRRLENDARGAHEHRQREDPEEQSIQDHGHVFPVLLHLNRKSFS